MNKKAIGLNQIALIIIALAFFFIIVIIFFIGPNALLGKIQGIIPRADTTVEHGTYIPGEGVSSAGARQAASTLIELNDIFASMVKSVTALQEDHCFYLLDQEKTDSIKNAYIEFKQEGNDIKITAARDSTTPVSVTKTIPDAHLCVVNPKDRIKNFRDNWMVDTGTMKPSTAQFKSTNLIKLQSKSLILEDGKKVGFEGNSRSGKDTPSFEKTLIFINKDGAKTNVCFVPTTNTRDSCDTWIDLNVKLGILDSTCILDLYTRAQKTDDILFFDETINKCVSPS